MVIEINKEKKNSIDLGLSPDLIEPCVQKYLAELKLVIGKYTKKSWDLKILGIKFLSFFLRAEHSVADKRSPLLASALAIPVGPLPRPVGV
jgi:hypothetical protein